MIWIDQLPNCIDEPYFTGYIVSFQPPVVRIDISISWQSHGIVVTVLKALPSAGK
jgi:hypothetical protein